MKTIRSMLALLLAVLLLGSLSVVAFAEDTEPKYPEGQSYTADEGETQVYTVQVSAGPNLDGAERTRDQMLKAGFDSFLYEVDGGYRIMCGKFQYRYNAKLYLELIKEATKRENAYVTDVTLPDAAIEDFVEHYQKDPFVAKAKFLGWETTDLKFVDMNVSEEETATVYIVRYSGGANFKAAEARAKELTEQGFDGYLIKVPCCYIVAAGAFDNWDEAYALCKQIRETTGRMGTGVQELKLPASLLG